MYTNHVSEGHHSLPVHNAYSNHMLNGHTQHQPAPSVAAHPPPPPPSHRAPAPPQPKDPVTVLATPSVSIQDNRLIVGDAQSTSTRSYTPLKMVGDGSFGTVWLCDWHGTLPPNTPMSAMQCGAGARPEYAGKRLVAVKRMKKRWEGGWDECKKLKELESLRALPYHENIIPLYDFFLLPTTKELYFVFESMEGNLYQLIKARRGKPLAGGLICSIFQQVVSGLHHIHSHGYFHRDMKPENLLVTTTGLYDYRSLSSIASPNAQVERDVVAIVKLADFGLARETKSKPPYTEYVSTRWYRAPEVLLKSRDYSNPVDMWALGTIMAELVNLRPLFPGQNELEQLMRICELLGDPCQDYGPDERGKPIGGGRWSRGVKMARGVGFEFRKMEPQNFYALFDRSVPVELVECIADLLKYDPDARLTSRQCLEHPYLLKFAPLNNPPKPSTLASQTSGTVQPVSTKLSLRNGSILSTSLQSIAPRHLPPSHTYTSISQKPEFQPSAPPANAHIPDASSSHRSSFYDTSSARPRAISDTSSRTSDYGGEPLNPIRVVGVSPQIADSAYASSVYSITGADRVTHSLYAGSGQSDWDAMDVSPHVEVPEQYIVADNQSTEIQTSPMAREYPSRPVQPEPIQDHSHTDAHDAHHSHGHKLAKLPFGFGKKHSKWGLGMFGHGDKSSHTLPPVQEVNVSSANSTPSLKRTQTSSTDSRSLSELSPISEAPTNTIMDAKTRKKEAERIVREAEKQRREHARKKHRDQARAVMEKQKLALTHEAAVLDWQWLSAQNSQIGAPPAFRDKGKQPMAMGPIRQSQSHGTSSKLAKAAGSVYSPSEGSSARADWRRDERVPKARRREFDDDHSMSSTDLPSGMSVISFATVDSDPGPARSRHRMSSSVYSGGDRVGRMTSLNSLRTCMDEYSLPGRSSASLSLEQQLVNEFHIRASVDSSSLSDGTSSPPPPPMHMLSLSSPPWQQSCDLSSNASTLDSTSTLSRLQDGMSLSLHPSVRHPVLPGGQSYGRPPSPGVAPKSAINPMFKVPPLQGLDRPGSLPPFSQLEAVADGEYPPLSPMSFTSPDEMSNDES